MSAVNIDYLSGGTVDSDKLSQDKKVINPRPVRGPGVWFEGKYLSFGRNPPPGINGIARVPNKTKEIVNRKPQPIRRGLKW